MKHSVRNKMSQNPLWIAVFASLIGLSACSNGTEDVTDTSSDTATIDSSTVTTAATDADPSEMAPVQSAQNNGATMANPTDSAGVDNASDDKEGAYYSGVESTADEEKAVDAVAVNENNPNLDQTPAEGVQ